MKRFILLLAMVLLVGCAQQAEKEQPRNNDSLDKTETATGDGEQAEDNEANQTDGDTGHNAEEDNDNEQDSEQTTDSDAEKADPDPAYRLNEIYFVEPIADAKEKVVLLTIDDAPDEHSLEMAKTLKKLDTDAIFFVNGHFIDTKEEQETLKKIHDLGFPIGNHTMNHTNLETVSRKEQKKEMLELNDLIEDVIGERPVFFRAPHGANTDYSFKLAKQEDMLAMNWSYGYDFKPDYQTKKKITDIMLNTPLLSNGANLLMHDRKWTEAALEDIVKGLKEKGYSFVDPALIQTP